MSNNPTDEGDSHQRPSVDGKELEWQTVVNRPFECDSDVDLVKEIIAAVAAAEDLDTTAITPPLFEVVNVPALEDLFFGHTVKGNSYDCTGQIRFRYRGLRVTVVSEGRVVIAVSVREEASE